MSLVRHGKSPFWYYRFSRNGRVYFGSTKETNKTKAARVELEKINEAETGTRDLLATTIGEAFEQYLGTLKGTAKINCQSRVKTLLGTKQANTGKQVSIYGFNGSDPLTKLTTAAIQRLIIERRATGSSNGTLLHDLNVISQSLKLASKLGYATPTIDFAAIKRDNNIRPGRNRLRFLTIDEEHRLLTQLDPTTAIHGVGKDHEAISQRQDAFDIVVILLDAGARYSEIATLQWKSVDLENRVIHLYRPKVRNESLIVMTDRAYAVLSRRFEHKREDQQYVFEATDGSARKYCPKAFNSACKRAEIEGVSLHTLRHTHASKLVQAGIPLYDVSQQLGHTSVTTTAIYAHLAPNQSAVRVAAVLNQVNSATSKE